MVVNTDVKLKNPKPFYGAVYGRNQKKQNLRYVFFAGFILLWVVAVATFAFLSGAFGFPQVWVKDGSGESWGLETLTGIATLLTFGLPVVGLFGGIQSLLFYINDVWEQDMYRLRAQYAYTVFKDWFEKRYDVRISKETALSLMNGRAVEVLRKNPDTGKDEYVEVMFDYSGFGFKTLAEIGRLPNDSYIGVKDKWTLDVEAIEFRLLIIERPAQPRTYLWT